MESSGGTDGSLHCPHEGPPWSGRQRDRRGQKERPLIDLTDCPRRSRPLVGSWIMSRSGNDTRFFNIIVETLLPFLRRRRIDEEQGRNARQALRQTNELSVARHDHIGYLFSWSDEQTVYFIAVREEDTLTARLDEEQWQFGKTPQQRILLAEARKPKHVPQPPKQDNDKVRELIASP